MKNVMRSIVVIGWVGVGSGGMCCLYTRHKLDIQKLLREGGSSEEKNNNKRRQFT